MAKKTTVFPLSVVAVLLSAFSLRLVHTGISPLQPLIQEDLQVNFGTLGMIATLPLIIIGVVTFALPIWLRYRLPAQICATGIALMALFVFAPLVDHIFWLYLLVACVGAGVAITQASLPAVFKTYFDDRRVQMTAIMVCGLHGGAAISSGISLDIARWLGSWQWAIFVWGLPALAAWLLWRLCFGKMTLPRETVRPTILWPWRLPKAWAIASYFSASGIVYISLLTWLPALYVERGTSQDQGNHMLAVCVVGQLVAAFAMIFVSNDTMDKRWLLGSCPLLVLIGVGLVFVVPVELAALPPFLMGLGLGAGFTTAMSLPLDYGHEPAHTGALTTMALGLGTLVSAPFPYLIGHIKDLTQSINSTIWIVVICALVLLAVTPQFRPRHAISHPA